MLSLLVPVAKPVWSLSFKIVKMMFPIIMVKSGILEYSEKYSFAPWSSMLINSRMRNTDCPIELTMMHVSVYSESLSKIYRAMKGAKHVTMKMKSSFEKNELVLMSN